MLKSILLFLILSILPAKAQVYCRDSNGNSVPITSGNCSRLGILLNDASQYSPIVNSGQYALSINSVQTLTVPSGALVAEICVETASARYTTTGTVPSSAIGIPVSAGWCFQLAGAADLAAFKIIGAGATLDVEYFK